MFTFMPKLLSNFWRRVCAYVDEMEDDNSKKGVNESGDDDASKVDLNYTPACGRPDNFTQIVADEDGECKVRVERVEVETDQTGPTTYQQLGTDIPLNEDDEELHFQCYRIKKLENLEKCKKLRKLELIANCIEKIENLDENLALEHLELYQNLVKKMENISHLVNLRTLDLSFNKIRKINCLQNLHNLERLYLSANKIVEVKGLDVLVNVKLLELGANRIRKLENISHMKNLEELWVGKNKLTSMELPPLPKLKRVSYQNNRLEEWDESFFQNCPNITHLYLGHNKLPDFPEYFDTIKQLEELDMASNAVNTLRRMDLPELKELWLNYNNVASLEYVKVLDCYPKLETVYLEHNPIWKPPPHDELYSKAILAVVPDLKQLDAYRLQGDSIVICKEPEKKMKGIRKK
eukprot:GEMP01029786.1.p1 GENE.GEMP01029786.1~~GEMP01029786.1.p1  ORF type:complete len:407 (+),score=72.46 GEMP01029786.1:46-1266(+)